MQGQLKIFVLQPGEGWIVDTIGEDFISHTGMTVVHRPEDADIIWLLGSWCWDRIDASLLKKKIVVCSVHHIVPEKFDQTQFMLRDRFVDAYFVYTAETADTIRRISRRPIARVAHWVDPNKWFPVDKGAARVRLGINPDEIVIGSFQRDTEGKDLTSPKLEKGPDIFCDVVERVNQATPVRVLLGGWRREYVIGRLHAAGVKHIFMQLPPQETVRDMYAACDYYLCTARHEGGPQCILEAAAMRVPIVSTPVGIARDVLHDTQIIDPKAWFPSPLTEEALDYAHKSAMLRDPKKLILSYDSTFEKVYEITIK